MSNKRIVVFGLFFIFIIGIFSIIYFNFFYSPYKFRGEESIKILILNSYDLENYWSLEQIDGFRDYLDEQGMDFEVKIFNMGFFEQLSGKEQGAIIENVTGLIEEYNPDLIYGVGDLVKLNIGIDYVNDDIPWVFSGLTEVHGFENDSENMAGVIGLLELSKYLDFFRELYPGTRRMAMINGDDDTRRVIVQSIMKAKGELAKDDAEFIGLDVLRTFEEFKERVFYYQDKVDFLVFDDFAVYVNENGEIVSQDVVIRWLLENNNIPSFSYDKSVVEKGVLCSILPSMYGQGGSAARYAYDILIEGEAPSRIGFNSARYVDKHINILRANQLGLEIPSVVLVNSEVYDSNIFGDNLTAE
ncbi:MAG: hypothetical protein OQK82_02690 [Candidatus Pacearchaeota archaeon]|nr:hypothetical protein [Candidatus Pacearchaeota archaeon]